MCFLRNRLTMDRYHSTKNRRERIVQYSAGILSGFARCMFSQFSHVFGSIDASKPNDTCSRAQAKAPIA